MPVIICDKEKGGNLQLANNDELSGDDGSHVEQAGQKDVVKVAEENQEVLDVATRSKGKRLSLFHPLDTGCSEKFCFFITQCKKSLAFKSLRCRKRTWFLN